MKSAEAVQSLEKLVVQLNGLHAEISLLGKKSPNDGLNLFKLQLVNKVLAQANEILQGQYRPFEGFSEFDAEALPTNSDVTMILALYIEQSERFRSDSMEWARGRWVYRVDGEPSDIQGKQPTRIGMDKK